MSRNEISVAIDSNLLLLFVVGTASRDYIGKHKRLRPFEEGHFDLLMEELSVATKIVLTPHTLAETSNLIDHIGDPARTRIYETLRRLILHPGSEEIHVSGNEATSGHELPRLG